MANVKISQLPAASTVTADVDVLPIVHSGVTEKVTPNQIVNKVLEAPGEIGGTTPGDATFTTLTAESSVFLNPANADVELSPTGSGRTLIQPEAGAIINPGVLSYMDNVAIGGTTPQAAVFTTLTSNSTATLNGTTIPASKTLVDTDSVQTLSSKYYLNPRIWDWDQNNYYRISPVSPGLATDVYCYLPILTGNDYFSFRNFTETLTNKTISGLSNTLTDIPNSSFQYSSITLGSTSISLGGTASSITGLALTGGTVNNTAIGGTTPAAGSFTTLSSTGNTTLGDASTDTVTVTGYMGVGGAGDSSIGIKISSSALTGATQYGLANNVTATSSATTRVAAFNTVPGTAAAAFTVPNLIGYRVADASKGAGSTITNLHGLYIEDQTQGTNNYGITSAVSSGTNKWNIYASGTANNYFAGNVGIGTSSPVSGYNLTLSGSTNNNLVLQRTSTTTTGGLWLFANNASASSVSYAGILGQPSNTTAGSEAGSLLFYTKNAGSLAERLRIDSSGNLGLGVTPDNSYNACLQLKSGITFPATQIASSNANTLDDYEEGTFTPTYYASSGSFTYYSNTYGRYTKIGNIVNVQISISTNSATGSGDVYIYGLPFASAIRTAAAINSNSWATFGPVQSTVDAGATFLQLNNVETTSGVNYPRMKVSDMVNASGGYNQTNISITYRIS